MLPEVYLSAATRIAPYIWRTPLELSRSLSKITGARCWLKMETYQRTGSFKMRGAMNRMLMVTDVERHVGVVTASAGNHAQGVAAAAEITGIHATICVARDASPAKIAALQLYDPAIITLIREGRDYDDAEAYGIQLAHATGRQFISPYNDPFVIAGQGTIALEIFADLPSTAMILVPVGGGGLVSGIGECAHGMKRDIRIIGVQSQASPAMSVAMQAGKYVPVPIEDSIADGLAGNVEQGSMTLQMCMEHVEHIALVQETDIRMAMRWLIDEHHQIVEGSGAVGIAALLTGTIRPEPGSDVVIVLSGRNVTTEHVAAVLQHE